MVLALQNRRVMKDTTLCIAHYDEWIRSRWYEQNVPGELHRVQQEGLVLCDIQAVVHGVHGARALICLNEIDGDRQIAIPIAWPERYVLSWMLKREQLSRPYTHQAMASIIAQLNGVPTRGVIDFVDYTSISALLHAKLVIQHSGKEVAIDMRPSDMCILTVILETPIYVASSILSSWKVDMKSESWNDNAATQ